MDDNDYIDELNWYTEDFDVSKSKTEKKKEKRSVKPSRHKSNEKERRHKQSGETSKYVRSSGLIDVIQNQFKRVSDTKRKDRNVVKKREHTSVDIPLKKMPKIEKPDIKLYEPIKSFNKAKETEPFESHMFVKTSSKSVETAAKAEMIKIPEPITTFSKNVINNKAHYILSEKLLLLEERDKLIRSNLEKPSNLKQATAIKGICPDMCPEKERIMRSFKKMVSVFECLPNSTEMDPKLAVKEYARSSADQEEPLSHELRPEPVLTMSMSYIITRIITMFEECEDISAWYDFCWNRLRAIRKDIVQQQLCDLETVTIVEQCARFHIVCFDRFWGMDSSIFDEKINTENLMNCLKILLNLYGDLRKLGVICPNEPEFNAYMILIKMNTGDLLWEFLNFPLSLQQTSEVIEAVKIHMFYNNNMFSQFFNYLLKTSYLNACLMQRCFTQLRVRALEAIVKAYCPPNKEGKVPLQHIMKSLKFDTKEDTLAFCKSCNIWYIERTGFKISHSKFIRPETLLKIKTPSSLVCNKRVDFAQAVIGVYNSMPVYFEHTVHNSFLNDKTLHADALDASDQEEKMLRDDVERKLLLKNAKSSQVKEGKNNSTTPPLTPILQRSLSNRTSLDCDTSIVKQVDKPSVESFFTPEPEELEIEEGEMSESEDYDMPDASSNVEDVGNREVFDEDNDNAFVDAQDKNSLDSDKDAYVDIFVDTQQISPLSAISDVPVEEEEEKEVEVKAIEEEVIAEEENEPTESTDESNESNERTSPVNDPPASSPTSSSSTSQGFYEVPIFKSSDVSQTKTPLPERRSSVCSQKETKSSALAAKLRCKLRVNLQKISAKKYGRIWREKVREIKKSYGFIPLVSHINMKEYLNVWGRSVPKPSSILNQLSNTKKLCLSVESLLLFNMFDMSVNKLVYPLCESLVERKLNVTRSFENINQNSPIFWKLVFSVPSSKVSNYDLYDQVVCWSEHMFFTSEVARNTGIETMTCKGIKVHCRVIVQEGSEKLDRCQNLSALVMLNVPGWESNHETQTRLNRLTSFTNHPIPVFIINLAPSQTSLIQPSTQSVSFYTEITASPSTNFVNILKVLASNSYQMSVKSLHLCDLMNEMLDKFLDALQDDCYNSTGFLTAMSDPTNILYLYNILIDKLKSEVINLYKTNIYGTANEIISTITPNSKYSVSLSSILSDYFDSLIMNKLPWPPSTSSGLLSVLQKYCDKSGIPQVLSHIIRMINPPDDDAIEEPLSVFLSELNWLRIMEVIVKANFRTKFCDVIVTYSEKSINDLIDSHWWMECSLILKYCKS